MTAKEWARVMRRRGICMNSSPNVGPCLIFGGPSGDYALTRKGELFVTVPDVRERLRYVKGLGAFSPAAKATRIYSRVRFMQECIWLGER